ncbi:MULTISPECIES: tyrosine-type recombinase/integrase [Aeromonas]|uniref:tyrosine-type recombinase/integrase n=1 Tax=Aeromonas TaxID=642 RepID=UPI000C78E449|nr:MULTISPECIES: site-specific integrase [Aeromonas]ELO1556226.1 tyrosine-type recombinase/integrase [Aeromonas hydrophila]AWA05509.1 tyrosine-type recombinase/integrase [Aeromonas hydrophila subsp. hydrophila]HDT5894145.1 tyrosine-type recombinase/integrase [Aeromonas hydrophila subsp. hydrophila]HEH9419712.1 tyrosine-type recombinase/integrase [Aeromonas sobria]HEH9433172.1 tyrosine-type recombinase/integrase [Aeromonas sobria]
MAISKDLEISSLKPVEGVKVKRYAIQSKHGGGLKIEIRESGLKRFVYRFKIGGSEGELLLGSYPALTLAKAREEHGKAVLLVKRGIDPTKFAAQEKAKNETALTMDELLGRWLEAQHVAQAVKPKTLQCHQERWNRHLKKSLGNIRLIDLTRAHLAQALEITRRATKDETRKGLGTLNQMLDYAVVHCLIEANPARLLRPKDFGASAGSPRERWLTVPELRRLWKAIDEDLGSGGSLAAGGRGVSRHATISLPAANAIKLLLLTGCRRGEVANMRFSHIRDDIWTIPDTKNGKPHSVFLSRQAKALIDEQALYVNGDFVFESDRPKSDAIEPILVDSITRALRRFISRSLSDMEPFTVHDLRRSAATNWAERLDAEERVIELCLNHLPLNKLVRTYHRSRHDDKKKMLWQRWGELVELEIANEPQKSNPHGNVIEFVRKVK